MVVRVGTHLDNCIDKSQSSHCWCLYIFRAVNTRRRMWSKERPISDDELRVLGVLRARSCYHLQPEFDSSILHAPRITRWLCLLHLPAMTQVAAL